MTQPAPMPHRLLRFDEVASRVSLGRSAIYGRIREKTFPTPVHLGEHTVAWVEAEVQGWIEARIAERDKGS